MIHKSEISTYDVLRSGGVSFESKINTRQNKSVNLDLSINQLASIKQLENITKKSVFIGFQNLPLRDSLIIDDNTFLTKIFIKQFSLTARGSSLTHFNPDNFNFDDFNVSKNDSFLEYSTILFNIENKSFNELTSFINSIECLTVLNQVKSFLFEKDLIYNDTEKVFLQQLLKGKVTQLSLKKFVDKIFQSLNNELKSVVYLDWDYHSNTPFNGADVAKELKSLKPDIFIVLITSSSFDNLLKRLSLDCVDGILITSKNASDFNITNIELNNYLSDFLDITSTPQSTPEIKFQKVYGQLPSEFRKPDIVPIQDLNYSHDLPKENLIPLKISFFSKYVTNPLKHFTSNFNCISNKAVHDLNLMV